MRRIIHNSTAIAATLAFMIPQIMAVQPAAAQGSEAQPLDKARTAMAQQLAQEVAAGLTADMLICLDGSALPCADGKVMVTPEGLPVELTPDGTMVITTDQGAIARALDGALPVPAPAQQAETQPAPPAPAELAPDEQQQAQPAQQPQDQQQAQQQQQPAEVQQDALAEALAQQQQQQPADPAPAAGGGQISLSDNPVNTERSAGQPEMFSVLQAEIAQGLTAHELSCVVPGVRPCPPGTGMITPMGVTVDGDGVGKVVLAPADRQVNVILADGTLGPRPPEQGLQATEAAIEAAKETGPVTAAALAQDTAPQQADLQQQQVTQADARSSTQDFETRLRDALTTQDNSQASSGGNDNDLTKAILLGLGAVAASQVLGEDRQVALAAPDRVVVQRADGSQEVIKDEMVLLRQPGSTVTTENFDDGSSRTIVTREDGTKVVTIRDAELRVLRRTLISVDGKTTQLIDDSAGAAPVDVSKLPAPAPVNEGSGSMSEEQLRQALQREANVNRRFSLGQIRNIPEVRALVAPINIDAITFDTGSAAIRPDQARQLAGLGNAIQQAITANPREVYLIEGHTDTVGSNAMNLALSDRRAESVALALTEYFGVPPENLVVQGYGEQFLKIRVDGDIRANRRASVRRITDLLQTASN